MKKIMQGIGSILIIFAIADFGLSFMGINLTPFLPDGISKFSPIIIGLLANNWKHKKRRTNDFFNFF